MADNRAEFAKRNAQLIAIAAQDVSEAVETTSKLKEKKKEAFFPILADVEGSIGRAYHIFGLLDSSGQAETDERPSVFVINRDKRIVWLYIGTGDYDRPKAAQVISQLPTP